MIMNGIVCVQTRQFMEDGGAPNTATVVYENEVGGRCQWTLPQDLLFSSPEDARFAYKVQLYWSTGVMPFYQQQGKSVAPLFRDLLITLLCNIKQVDKEVLFVFFV